MAAAVIPKHVQSVLVQLEAPKIRVPRARLSPREFSIRVFLGPRVAMRYHPQLFVFYTRLLGSRCSAIGQSFPKRERLLRRSARFEAAGPLSTHPSRSRGWRRTAALKRRLRPTERPSWAQSRRSGVGKRAKVRTWRVRLRRGPRKRRLRVSLRRECGSVRPELGWLGQAAASRLAALAGVGRQFHGSSSVRRWAGWDAMRPSTSASQA